MLDWKNIENSLNDLELTHYLPPLKTCLSEAKLQANFGDWLTWCNWLKQLPSIQPSNIEYNKNSIIIGNDKDLKPNEAEALTNLMLELVPWRKGPFSLFDIDIDAEWQCHKKWQRINKNIDFKNKAILDIGSNNGYFSLRMLGEGASWVLGVDPQIKALVQFYALNHYMQNTKVQLLPLRLETMVEQNILLKSFDIVFAMGTLYHNRNPINHLTQIKQCLQIGGVLVLETLAIDDAKNSLITPQTTYAGMKNVWFIPSCDLIITWLQRLGFDSIEIINKTLTTTNEQRPTKWMPFNSLENGLNPQNHKETAEGLPMATRVVFTAKRKF